MQQNTKCKANRHKVNNVENERNEFPERQSGFTKHTIEKKAARVTITNKR